MFAVMILGIGFIMVAAMFPVAIEQSQATIAETTGTIGAESAVRTLTASPKAWLDAAPIGVNFGPMGMGAQQISASDPKFGFIGFKSRLAPGTPATYNLIAIAVAAQNTSTFPPGAIAGDLNAANHTAVFDLQVHTADPTRILFGPGNEQLQAVEGAYVLINSGPPLLQGKVLVLGAALNPASGIYQVLPGPALGAEGTIYTDLTGFVIGRGLNDPTNPTSGWSGPSIAVHASEMRTVIK